MAPKIKPSVRPIVIAMGRILIARIFLDFLDILIHSHARLWRCVDLMDIENHCGIVKIGLKLGIADPR